MGKKARRRIKRDPLAGKRIPPFGATKAQGKEFAKVRALHNRIFELEQLRAGDLTALSNIEIRIRDVERAAKAAQLSEDRLNSLRRIVHLPLHKHVELGTETAALVIARWLLDLEKLEQVKEASNR
jgi:hypothetical protein